MEKFPVGVLADVKEVYERAGKAEKLVEMTKERGAEKRKAGSEGGGQSGYKKSNHNQARAYSSGSGFSAGASYGRGRGSCSSGWGANPPSTVIAGFIKRVWQTHGVDKVSFLPNDIFLVRFKTKKQQQVVLNTGHLLFDNKPVIIKEWTPDAVLIKHDVQKVPVCMKLHGLEVKFWGNACLRKLSEEVGRYIKCDDATANRSFFGYARVLIEVQIGQEFPKELLFKDELGSIQKVRVDYDWLPLLCTQCKGMGHDTAQCRKAEGVKPVKRVWKPKTKADAVPKTEKVTQVPATPVVTPVAVSTPHSASAQVVTPAVPVPKVTEEPSLPRRILSRMMRQEIPDSRQYSPQGITFLDALNMTISRSVGIGKRSFRKIQLENGKHKGGRIWLIWQPSQFVVTVKYITDQLIHSSVYDKLRNINFHFTIVYGLNKDKERKSLWEDLGLIRNGVTSAWMVCGDFNSLMHLDERVGGTTVSWNEVMPMRDMVAKCDLVELKTMGALFTWNNKHKHSSKVYSKIDRVLIDDTWLKQFPDCFAHFLLEGLFDHCPCLIQFHNEGGRKGVPFKYFNMWSMLDNFKQMDFQKKLRTDPLNEGLYASEAACAKELVFLKKARAQYLLQKSKEQWMEEGDENTSFYHNRSSKPVAPINHGIVRKGACLTTEHKKLLLQPVTDEEVRAAMFSIPGTKAPGPDGYSSQFFKDTWVIVGKDVIKAVRSVFTSGKLLKECNATILTLIPKVQVPEAFHQFRPIACVAKVLCTRLSAILPEIISPSQSAFTKGRDIVGNILICQDLIKLYNRKASSPRVIMKIDLQKAYESVEWAFLHEMLEALNFPSSIIAILMQCVSTPTYSIALNGNIFGYFKGRRGLRQGDPLSPLIFTICLEYLSRILAWVQQQKEFRFHPLCKRVQLSHLCFADDLIMFCRGDLPSVVLLLRAFKTFSKASGLNMNKGKSNIYSNGVDNSTMARLIRFSGIQRGTVPFRRVVLIKSVLHNLHNYWARVFILPKTVLHRIDCVCRQFLWHSNDMKEGPAIVAWDSICKSKRKGGLGLRSLYWWNIAAVAKYAWWIAKKTDHLWVRWVHVVYMKDKTWEDYIPGQGTSWSWRKICWTKDLVKQQLFSVDDYSIKLGYSWLVEEGPDKEWHKWFPNSIMVPRHSFILWLVAHKRMLTQDRLRRMGIAHDRWIEQICIS
ncbi:uncharacterized protein LOC141630990 [Silene latifolia]|uniref:uncharacterized protein LOC141630990 n=1 Tax=Silene latifolia TaxID=37657 RepID=UPI003D772B8F